MRLTAKGRELLATAIRLTAEGRFTAKGAKPLIVTRPFTIEQAGPGRLSSASSLLTPDSPVDSSTDSESAPGCSHQRLLAR